MDTTNNTNTPPHTVDPQQENVQILQINLNHCRAATLQLGEFMSVNNINIALLQDPFTNSKTGRPLGLGNAWHSVNSVSNTATIITNLGTAPIHLASTQCSVAILLENNEKHLTIINAYAPPSADFNTVLEEIQSTIDNHTHLKHNQARK